METKANYFYIGLFTLLGLLASLAFLLWLAKVEVDKQFAYYDILFDNVTGLSTAGAVRYNGLPVGQVVDLKLDPDDPAQVRVRIEVDAETPVKTDTVAILQGQGVTGVSFVALTGGSAAAQALPQNEVIKAEASAWQSVLEGAPALLQKAVVLLDDINDVVNDENKAAITEVLSNLASASGRLDRTLADFENLSGDLGQAAQQVASFTERLETLADTADGTLTTASETLKSAQAAIAQGETTLATAQETLQTMDATFASATTLLDGDLSAFVREGTEAATTFTSTLKSVEPVAVAALTTAEAALIEAGQTFAATNRILNEDIDGIITDLRGAASVFTDTMRNASANIDTISGEVLAASQSIAGFAGTLETVVTGNQRQISNFLRLGLPEFLRFAEEARQLVRNLDRFVDRVERDPARFFLGTQGSEFRR